MTRTQENIEMKRTLSTENLDCVLAHLLECSPLMREPACSMPQSYPCLLQSRQKRSEAAALNMYKWHWLQSEGKYQGLAAIICGAGHPTIMPNNPSLSSSSSAKKTTDIPFFFSQLGDAYSRIPFCLNSKQWGSDRLGNIGVGSPSPRVPHPSTGRIWCK